MIGIDLVSVDKFSNISKSDFPSWKKFFTEWEWDTCFADARSAQRLAGVFAAKEAVMKAVGGELMKRFDRIGIKWESNGRPLVTIDNVISNKIFISISHDGNLAVAMAQFNSD